MSEKKVALITGGGTGVGKATACALAKLGWNVAINYSRSQMEADRTKAELQALGADALAIQADVALDADCQRLVQKVVESMGRLDVLVNNAATTRFIPHGDLNEVSIDDWQRILNVNLVGPFQCARAARQALERANGQIINVASTAGINAMGSSIPYCASKAALINLTMSLARALAPSVRVNAVAPGFITGRWLENGLGPAYDVVKATVEGKLPLGRVCDPQDVADAIVSLITGSRQVTGQTLVCDAGMALGKSPL